jgi:hypothetical protein
MIKKDIAHFFYGSLYVVIGKTPLKETAGNDWQFL